MDSSRGNGETKRLLTQRWILFFLSISREKKDGAQGSLLYFRFPLLYCFLPLSDLYLSFCGQFLVRGSLSAFIFIFIFFIIIISFHGD